MAWRDIPGVAWTFLTSQWRSIAFIAFGLAVVILVWRPFDQIEDPNADDIAAAWNESIGRLGITPVYPPTEDLSVGDVWAFVAEIDKGDKARQLNSTPLLGKAVRIGHIDMRAHILAASKQPTFAETVEPVATSKIWKQDRWETLPPEPATNNRIPLSLTAFPGVSINHQSRTAAQAGAGTSWFGAQRQHDRQEQILIKSADSYGVATTTAIFALNKWCVDQKELCQDATVRKILSFTVGEDVLETMGKAKTYSYRLGVQLVTRVFLMRQIVHRTSDELARGAAIQAGAVTAEAPQAPVPAPTDTGNAPTPPGGRPIDGIAQGLTSSTSEGGRLSRLSADGVTMSLTETFQRPVAFGYRSVTISLKQSAPE